MKLRIAALTAAVALAAITLLAGCNKGASNINGTYATNSNSAGPTASPMLGDPKTSPTATPTTSTSASSPTAAFKAYYEAIQRKDAEAIKSLFSKATLKSLEDEAKRKNKSFDENFKEGLERASKDIPPTLPESRNEKIEGDSATLEIKDEKGKWDTIRFVEEDGQWKVSFADEEVEHGDPDD